MTKKDFKELTDYHQYTGGARENNVNALFFGWREIEIDGQKYRGFSHCVYARAINATKKVLEETLYEFLTGKIKDTPYYIQLVAIQNDKQRFRVPLAGSGLRSLIKYH